MTASNRQSDVLIETHLPDLRLWRRGKVRDVYDLGEHFLVVTTDRVSAFDVVLPNGIPDKGKVLTQISAFWFDHLGVPHHLVTTNISEMPAAVQPFAEELGGRSMLVDKLEMFPIECVARGYLAGSGWKEYSEGQSVCGIPLPAGLKNSDKLPEPIFTPATKAEEGHDENISFETSAEIVGADTARALRDRTLEVYARAADYARERGIIIADTKFEFGCRAGSNELVLGDEVLTPDSSRFWPVDKYAPGSSQPSFDKQFVRDHLLELDWDRTPPGPELPDDVVEETSRLYREIYERLTGRTWDL